MHRKFAFWLALTLRHFDVDAMLADMTSELLAEWMAYFVDVSTE